MSDVATPAPEPAAEAPQAVPAAAAPPTPPPAPATPPAATQPALEGRQFTFRRRTEEEDPVVPFVFNEQQFHLHPRRINALVAADFTVSMDSEPMWEFFAGVMGDEYAKFRKAVRDPMLVIEAEDLAELVKWMVEQAADRPT